MLVDSLETLNALNE